MPEPKRAASPSPRRTESPSPRAAPTPKRSSPAGARNEDDSPGPKPSSPGPKPRGGAKRPPTGKPVRPTKEPVAGSPPLSSAAPAAPAVADEELDHIRVFMRVASGAKGSQTSSCIGHDEHAAWALDFSGQRLGPAVTLDAVFGVDQTEAALYPEVIDHLVSDFVRAPRGVACLLCYGPADAGKASLMYGAAGSATNFTPRGLPAPGHRPQQREAGLVLRAIQTSLSQLHSLTQAYPGGSTPDGTRVPQAGQLQMACVMLHVELLKDLLSPQSPVRRPTLPSPK
jgi:hypothetical protein